VSIGPSLSSEEADYVERGFVGDFLGELGQIASVFEDDGLEGIRVITDIVKNPNKKWFDKYPRLRDFINCFRLCLGY
jgi:hypothetical protein